MVLPVSPLPSELGLWVIIQVREEGSFRLLAAELDLLYSVCAQ